MGQVTWRADDALVDRVRRAAREHQSSINSYLTKVLDAATDPELAGSEAERLRARLDAAGLLARPRPVDGPAPDPDHVERARRRAGEGTPLSELVRRGR